jgi:hypothetical protein
MTPCSLLYKYHSFGLPDVLVLRVIERCSEGGVGCFRRNVCNDVPDCTASRFVIFISRMFQKGCKEVIKQIQQRVNFIILFINFHYDDKLEEI